MVNIEIITETKTAIFFKPEFEIPIASCGNRYLNAIVETIVNME